jgi:UDP-N-acetylmuramoylalanine--D-glutamate ligase
MQDAVEKSFEIAKNENGEIVLLSPACSSYDMYPNYKKRGEDFVNCVKKLKIKEKN